MSTASFRSVLLLCVLGCVTGCHSLPEPKTTIVAHRGASGIAPENTVVSTVLAFQKEADISEIDVYLSSDQRMMVIHDKTTKRTAGVDLAVAETDAETLRELEVGSWKHPDYSGERIPFLAEIMDVIPTGKRLFIEIKCGPEIVPGLKARIDASEKMNQMVIIAGNLEVLTACRKVMPTVPTYWVKMTTKDKVTGVYPPYAYSVIQRAVDHGLTGLDLHYRGLTKAFVEEAHHAGLELYVWTINDVDDARRMVKYGVDGITTDVPGKLRTGLLF